MAIRNIVLMGNPSLMGVADPVADPTAPEIAELAADMQETLEAIDANGLAAPQIEVPLRVVVYWVPPHRIPEGAKMDPVPWTPLINPVIEPLSDEKKPIWERCLSLPGLYGKVSRYTDIRITYQNLDGTGVDRIARGYHAMLLQHECDHLDGMLYPRRMDDMTQFSFTSELGSKANPVNGYYSYDPAEFYE
jgi:peptide deformylase